MLDFFRKLVASDDIGPFATEHYVDERINRIEENDLPFKADLVDGKVPNSQLPDVSKIDIDDEMSSDSRNPVQNRVIKQALDNMPWLAGTGGDSVRQKQTNAAPFAPGAANSAISQSSVAEGASNVAGLKGYRYTNAVGSTITTTLTFDTAPDWEVGDVVSVINDSKYPDAGTIQSISGNTVTFTEPLNVGGTVKADDGWDARCAYVSAKPDKGDIDLGYGAHAEGVGSKALNAAAHAEGRDAKALGQFSHAEGRSTVAQYAAHAEGRGTSATGDESHAEGDGSTASGSRSHAEGSGSDASGWSSHAEGGETKAHGRFSHAEGWGTRALSVDSDSVAHGTHAEGIQTQAGNGAVVTNFSSGLNGIAAHAEGGGSAASGRVSHAEGLRTSASGIASHSEGVNTVAQNQSEHAQGQYNKSNRANATFGNAGNTLHSIGIGTADNARKNAVEVMQDGKVFVYGLDGYDGTNPTGSGVKDVATVVNGKQGAISDLDDIRDGSKSALFRKWYPDGSVTSESQFTQNLAYTVDGNGDAVIDAFSKNSGNSGVSGDVVIPPYVMDNGVRRTVVGIGPGSNTAYSDGITSVIAPTTVTSIGNNAFYYCWYLGRMSFPSVTSVGSNAFQGCDRLESISLPRTVSVGEYAFAACTHLKYVRLPSVESLGSNAFSYDAALLETIDLGDTPRSSVPTIGDFSNIYGLDVKFVVPDKQYDAWIAASGWSELYEHGHLFLRHSEWEYARRYEAIPLSETTWAQLKELRDNGNLVPGKQYRITDYVATTRQKDTMSAGHPFDIIVTANTKNSLCEDARAALHEGDQYFSVAGCRLDAWRLKYSLDNDGFMFDWAKEYGIDIDLTEFGRWYTRDAENDMTGEQHPYCWSAGRYAGEYVDKFYTDSDTPAAGDSAYQHYTGSGANQILNALGPEDAGKGVVYWMKDEFNNECPYDFKGIVMKAYGTTDGVYRYTFDGYSYGTHDDGSIHGAISNNRIMPASGGGHPKSYRINMIVAASSNNTFMDECHHITVEGYYNTFGHGCFMNYIQGSRNTFGPWCTGNRVSGNNNVFGGGSTDNVLYYCDNNVFGTGCTKNLLGNGSDNNSFGPGSSYNTLGGFCLGNSFGNESYGNVMGGYCWSNEIGTGCVRVVFGGSTPDEFSASSTYAAGAFVQVSDVEWYDYPHASYYRAAYPYKGLFSTSTAYSVNDCLSYSSKYYKCTEAHQGAWDAGHFTEVGFGDIFVYAPAEQIFASYYQNITVEPGNQYIFIDCTGTLGDDSIYMNVTVARGFHVADYDTFQMKSIHDPETNQDFRTTYQSAGSRLVSI